MSKESISKRGLDPMSFMSKRLHAYGINTEKDWVARTETFLAFLGIWTIPSMVVFFYDAGVPRGDVLGFSIFWLITTATFTTDYFIRMSLSGSPLDFIKENPLTLISIAFPAFRLLISFRVVRNLFKRGNFRGFAFIAASFVTMSAFLVYYFEHTKQGADIVTRFDAFWWAIVTSTTVGYGDEVPITNAGRGMAIGLMLVGLMLYAMITARIAQNFLTGDSGLHHLSPAQPARDADKNVAASPAPVAEPAPQNPELSDIKVRLDRIEALLNKSIK